MNIAGIDLPSITHVTIGENQIFFYELADYPTNRPRPRHVIWKDDDDAKKIMDWVKNYMVPEYASHYSEPKVLYWSWHKPGRIGLDGLHFGHQEAWR